MKSLRYLLVLGTLITASAFGAEILAPYLGPLEYKGQMGFSYTEGINPITYITIEIDSTVAEKLIILDAPTGWTYTLTGNVLELEGGTLSPGNNMAIPVSLGGYIAPNEYEVTSTGYTSGGETVQASGTLVVSLMVMLYALDLASAMRFQLVMATLGIGFIELILSRMLQRKPKEVESVADKLQPYNFGVVKGPKLITEQDQDLKRLIQSQEVYFADNISYTDHSDLSGIRRGDLKRVQEDVVPAPGGSTPDGKDAPLTEEMLEKQASELESKQGSILDTVEKPDLKIDQGAGITSDGDLIHISDDTGITFEKSSPPQTGNIQNKTKEGMSFSEISGLEVERLDVEYRNGDTPDHPKKLSGLSKHTNIELKRSDLDRGGQSQPECKGILRRIVDFFRSFF